MTCPAIRSTRSKARFALIFQALAISTVISAFTSTAHSHSDRDPISDPFPKPLLIPYPPHTPLASIAMGAKFGFLQPIIVPGGDYTIAFQNGKQMKEKDLSPDFPLCIMTVTNGSDATRKILPQLSVVVNYKTVREVQSTARVFIMFEGPGGMQDNQINGMLCDQKVGDTNQLEIDELSTILTPGIITAEFFKP